MAPLDSELLVLCPRCEKNHYTPYGLDHRIAHDLLRAGHPYPALSRMDNETYICSPCGSAEAMRDFAKASPIPPSEWPLGDPGPNFEALAADFTPPDDHFGLGEHGSQGVN